MIDVAARAVGSVFGFGSPKVVEEETPYEPEHFEELNDNPGLWKSSATVSQVAPKPLRTIGIVKPIVVDPQVVFNRLSSLYGTLKSKSYNQHFECPYCAHEWSMSFNDLPSYKDANQQLEEHSGEDVVCPDCNGEDELGVFHQCSEMGMEFTRQPTHQEAFSFGLDYNLRLRDTHNLKALFASFFYDEEEAKLFDWGSPGDNKSSVVFSDLVQLATAEEPLEVVEEDEDYDEDGDYVKDFGDE